LNQILMELHSFLLTLDKENLSGKATVQKGLLSDLLLSYRGSNGGDEEYIYMNKVSVGEEKDNGSDAMANGKAGKHVSAPQKGLPLLPRPGLIGREPFPLPPAPLPLNLDWGEGYYEEAQPYEETINDEGDALSSSYESYDEEEAVVRGNAPCPSAQHQWPSAEASIELVRDARICAFLWRKKWLGQWAKQLCVIKDCRLQCYKSSKEQTPLLDVSLLGCSVVYKEKQVKRKEHSLKIVPLGGEAIVLALQSKEQTEQWLKVIQEISPRQTENCETQHPSSDTSRLICTKGEVSERHSVASESGSSTDSHAETPDPKDVKKKYGAGLKFNLMNIGKKKTSLLDSPEKCVDTSGYLNVLVNSQWRSRWCLIRDGQLWFYSDKGKGKVSQPAVALGGCSVVPLPSPEHLYTFRIELDGTELATLEAKTSADMGQWLGFLLCQTGTRMEPEDLTYDYVNSERISTIINAAKSSMSLMQRRFSEPNAYIDSGLLGPQLSDDLYDDVASIGAEPEDGEGSELPVSYEEGFQEVTATNTNDPPSPEMESAGPPPPPPSPPPPPPPIEEAPVPSDNQETDDDIVVLGLTRVRSFLHTNGGKTPPLREVASSPATARETLPLEDSTAAQTAELDPSNHVEEEPHHRTPEPQGRTPELHHRTPELHHRTPEPRHRTPEPHHRTPEPQRRTPEPQHTTETPVPVPAEASRPEGLSSPVRPPCQPHRNPPPPPPPQSQGPATGPAPPPVPSPVLPAPHCTLSPGASVAHKAPQHGQAGGRCSPGQPPLSPQPPRFRILCVGAVSKTLPSGCPGAVEVKLGKNRTEADVRRYSEERDRLEKQREEVRSSLASFKKERREAREELNACQGDPGQKASLEAVLKQKDEACREAEHRRVEVELRLMEVRESLRKVEAGPFTLGTTLDSSHQEQHTSKASSVMPTVAPPPPPSTNGSCGDPASPVNSATALKNRPTPMMSTSKVNVMQKAKEWEKKSTS
ncbi:unnamed protein product, partial [Boreogadus saida]